MRLPEWLYAWAMRHYESLVYGPTWFMRPRFWIVLLVFILVWWAVATLLGWLGLPTRREL
jgi:hypothetical protein